MESKLKIRIGEKDDYFFGPGVADLLSAIKEYGSISKAASSMDLSYSKAWHMIKNSERGFNKRLTERVTGGAGGGMTRLTEDGRKLIECYALFRDHLQSEADRVFDGYFKSFL